MRYAVISALFLAACIPQEETAQVTTSSKGTCGAEGMQRLVGQEDSVLEKMRLKPPVRIIRPGTAVTMDHRPDRMNIDIDDAGKITRVWCG